MARRKQSEMTYAQRQADENDKFRKQALANAIAEAEDRGVRDTSDIDKFRREQYRQALREAKEAR